jgi:hypothetical protein
MVSVLAVTGLNSVNAQNMSTPENNMTSATNATMDGNMTSGNMTSGNMTSGNMTSGNMVGPTNMTSP